MPRRRFRDPDPQVRDRNKWDASGQPAIGGLSRIGGAGRGGTSTIVPRGGGRGDGGQVRIEHITLHAEANQTVASGGAGVSWDRIATAPTELRGFETCADTIGSTGSVVAIPIDVTGELEFGLLGEWAAYRGGGTIQLKRHREDVGQVGTDVDVLHDFNPGPIRSRLFWERQTGLDVRAGDTVTVELPNSSGSGAVLSWAEAQLRVIGATGPTSPPPPDPLPTWTTSEYNGDGHSGARYEVRSFVDNGNYTYDWLFTKVAGFGNIDFLKRERISDGAVTDVSSAYRFVGESFNLNDYDPAAHYDGQTSHRLWVTNGNGIDPVRDSYVEFTYNG